MTLDGDLGSSFIEYLTNEANQAPVHTEQTSAEGRLEDGITGTQKAIHSLKVPKQKMKKRFVTKAERAGAEAAMKKHSAFPEQMIVAGLVM